MILIWISNKRIARFSLKMDKELLVFFEKVKIKKIKSLLVLNYWIKKIRWWKKIQNIQFDQNSRFINLI